MDNSIRCEVEDFIQNVQGLRVAIVGETISDEFVEVVYEGPSMKSFCPVFKLVEGKKINVQQGGAAAIAGHLRDFVKHVELISNTQNEIVKTRYIDSDDKKKHVEINRIDNSGFGEIEIDTKDYDVVIVADFGHGFCDKLKINDGFHLMCQTNSNNFGFNRMSKWKNLRKKSVTMDLREASLQMNRKITSTSEKEIARLFNYEINADHMFITLGSKGSLYTNGEQIVHQTSYKSEIVDTIGAGDTFYAFCTMLSAVNPNLKNITVPALAASLSTTWLCNEKSVTRQSILNYADQFIR